MKSVLALFAVLALLLIANTSHARPSKGEYWHVMNGEAKPMIQDIMDMRNSADSALSNKKCDTKVFKDIVHEKLIVDESDPIPDLSIYHGDSHLKGKDSYKDVSHAIPDLSIYHGDSHLKGKKSYLDESDPIPDATIYLDESDPIPDATIYLNESDPIPDATIYHGDSHLKGKK